MLLRPAARQAVFGSGVGPVNVGAVIDPEDNNALFRLVDLIEHPVRTAPG